MNDDSFQTRVHAWMQMCFGETISADCKERNHRFLEEALELVQSCGCSASEAHQLVDYVFGRDIGEPEQEVGGVMVTLAALCFANGMNMHAAGEKELNRIWTKVVQIRAKQAAKPKHSPLPQHNNYGDLHRLLDDWHSNSKSNLDNAQREELQKLLEIAFNRGIALGKESK